MFDKPAAMTSVAQAESYAGSAQPKRIYWEEPEEVLPHPCNARPWSESDFEKHLNSLDQDKLYTVCAFGTMPLASLCREAGCLDSMTFICRGKVNFQPTVHAGRVMSIADRWQIGFYSSNGPDKTDDLLATVRDLDNEAGFPSLGLHPGTIEPEKTLYAVKRAFAAMRLVEVSCRDETPTPLGILDMLRWRSLFPVEYKQRHFAAEVLEELILTERSFNVSDGRVEFEIAEEFPYRVNRYRMKLIPSSQIEGFKAPLIGHGWSREIWCNRPTAWRDVVIDWRLDEVAGLPAAVS